MQWFKAGLLVFPDSWMLRHGLTTGAQDDSVKITFGHDGMMGIPDFIRLQDLTSRI